MSSSKEGQCVSLMAAPTDQMRQKKKRTVKMKKVVSELVLWIE